MLYVIEWPTSGRINRESIVIIKVLFVDEAAGFGKEQVETRNLAYKSA